MIAPSTSSKASPRSSTRVCSSRRSPRALARSREVWRVRSGTRPGAAGGERSPTRNGFPVAHATYFVGLAERAAPLLSTENNNSVAGRLQAEHANLRLALVRFQTRATNACSCVAAALWRFWHRRGYWQEGRGWLVRLLAVAEAVDDGRAGRPPSELTGAAWLAHYQPEYGQTDFSTAQSAVEEGRSDYRRLGATDGLIDILDGLTFDRPVPRRDPAGGGPVRGGARPVPHARRSRQNRRVPVHPQPATRELGEYARATALAQEALDLHHRSGIGGMARALFALGDVARELGEPPTYASGARRAWPSSGSWATLSVRDSPYTTSPSRPTRKGISTSPAPCARRAWPSSVAWMCRARRRCWRPWDRSWMPRAIPRRPSALTEALRLACRVGPRWVVAAVLEGMARWRPVNGRIAWRLNWLAEPLRSGRRSKSAYDRIGNPISSRRWRRRDARLGNRPSPIPGRTVISGRFPT